MLTKHRKKWEHQRKERSEKEVQYVKKSNTQVQNTDWIETDFHVNMFESTLTTASFFAAEEHVAGFKSPGGT